MTLDRAINQLELSRPVTLDAARKSYRRLALVYHPDVNKAPDAKDRFILIQEAFQFLNSKSEAEINNIHQFNFTRNKRGPIVMPESLLFADVENLFYIFHWLKKNLVLSFIFKQLNILFFLPKQAPALLKMIQIFLGFVFAFTIFPLFLASFIFLAIPYISYELMYEKLKSIYQNKTGLMINKYSVDKRSKYYFLLIRIMPAAMNILLIDLLLIHMSNNFEHIAIIIFSFSIASIQFLWILSILRDTKISLSRKV